MGSGVRTLVSDLHGRLMTQSIISQKLPDIEHVITSHIHNRTVAAEA